MGVPIGKQRPKEMAKPKCLWGCGRVNQGRKLWERHWNVQGGSRKFGVILTRSIYAALSLHQLLVSDDKKVSFVLVQEDIFHRGALSPLLRKERGEIRVCLFCLRCFKYALSSKRSLCQSGQFGAGIVCPTLLLFALPKHFSG